LPAYLAQDRPAVLGTGRRGMAAAGVAIACGGQSRSKEADMVGQRMWGGRVVGLAGLVAALGAGPGCDDAKKAPEPAVAAEPSAKPAEEPKPAPKPSAAPAAEVKVTEMVRIPAGSFMMGSNDGQVDEKPVRRVQVAAFEMDLTEVTVAQYQACVESQKCSYPDLDHFCTWDRPSKVNHPINCLDWDQSTAYCAAVGKRLPTEEEWEYAARGTDGRTWSWGNGAPPEGVCRDRVKQGTCAVDAVPVDSPFGLRGMAGNVWEWTASGYSENYSKKRETERRVYRGGSFYEENLDHMRATTRNRRTTNTAFDYIGFRCARTPGKAAK
jgi:formylglycine-generating enzyme required for sulfatase activity